MKRAIIILAAVAALQAGAEDSAQWLRTPSISPDGSTLAFRYKGDIWTVPVTGGEATRLTTSSAYDTNPVWSPDGTRIAFRSSRVRNNADIYVIPAKGGNAVRITADSYGETPLTWLNDSILLVQYNGMGSNEALVAPSVSQTYTVNVNRPLSRPRLYAHVAMTEASADSKGRILYQDKKGFENLYRKHERSAGTNDIWLKDGDSYKKLTDFNGHDNSPVWIDDNTMGYISERNGVLNVWTRTLDGTNDTQLTNFVDYPVRSLSRAANGTMAFTNGGSLYTLVPGKEPQKVNVTFTADEFNPDEVKYYTSNGVTDIAVNNDGSEIAFIVRGDVYVTSAKYKTTKRITNTPGQERVVSFSKDGRTLVYDSERDGQWALYTATIHSKDDKNFTYCTGVDETLLYAPENGKPAQQPAYSPDGTKIAFLRDRDEICVIDPATKKVNTALDGKYNYSYTDGDVTFQWSPDSKWLLTDYIGELGWNHNDVALVKADGSQVVNLTESGFADSNPRWLMDGRAVGYKSGRYGMKNPGSWGETEDVLVMMLDGDAWDEFHYTEEEAALAKEAKEEADKAKNEAEEKDKADKKDKKGKKNKKDKKGDKDKDKDADKKDEVKSVDFDLENRRYRTARLTRMSGFMGDYYLSNDGSKLYYIVTNADGNSNLMVRDMRKGDVRVLTGGVGGSFVVDAKGENIYFGAGGISKIQLSDGKRDNIEFEALYDRKPSLDREYMYRHMASQVADKFHDIKLHGTDWKKVVSDYEKFLPAIDNNYDFAELMSEALGELNASHTGSGYRAPGAEMATGRLGAFYDDSYQGEGLKVKEVLKRGPLSSKAAHIEPGDIILAIDGTTVAPGADPAPLLSGKIGRKVRLTVKRTNGKTEDIQVRPTGDLSGLLYERWVERNEALVDSLSGGRVGYVHIQGMNSPSFSAVYSRLLGRYRDCDAVVVDTRWNGGGWLHNDVALLLGGHQYVTYAPRGKEIGIDPFSQWTKPSAMLVNESNYSDAHGTPFTYKTLGIGTLVGAPVPGTMTAVWWEDQVDPSIYFGIPQVTSVDREGNTLENHQLMPDVLIYNNPGDVARGHDAQLEGAVKTLLEKLPANR